MVLVLWAVVGEGFWVWVCVGGVEQPVCPVSFVLGGQLGQVQARASGGVL